MGIAATLLLTTVGAAGQTRRAMVQAMGVPEQRLHAANTALAQTLGQLAQAARPRRQPGAREGSSLVRLAICTSLWTSQEHPPRPPFIDYAQQLYQAQVVAVDFAAPDTPDRINEWARQQTAELIPRILNQLDPLTNLLVLNAVAFKGLWELPFDPELTRPESFYLPDGTTRQLPLMSLPHKSSLRYYQDEQVQIASLPYQTGGDRASQLSMEIILPAPELDLASFSRLLTSQQWRRWQAGLAERKGMLKLPRFRCEFTGDLKQVLSSLGMGVAFGAGKADFAYLSDWPLYIGQVTHKTTLIVDELGTEATAITMLDIHLGSSLEIAEERPFYMVVDRPFFCAIREQASGALLFMGLIVDPEAAV